VVAKRVAKFSTYREEGIRTGALERKEEGGFCSGLKSTGGKGGIS